MTTMKEMVDEYNKLTGKNIKKFENKEVATKRLIAARLASPKVVSTYKVTEKKSVAKQFDDIATQIVKKTQEKTYTPKQLEGELGKGQLAIRKKLRQLYPDKAKKGAWKITLEMLNELRKAI